MFRFASKPLNTWGVLRESIKLTLLTLPQVWIIALAAMLLNHGLQWMVLADAAQTIGPQAQQATQAASSSDIPASPFHFAFILQMLLAIIIAPALMGGMLHRMYGLITQPKKASFQATFNAISARYWTLLGASVLQFAVLVLGYILLIIPGIYLSVALCAVFPLVLFDRMGPIESLRESRQLVKGHWWQVFSIFFTGVVVLVIPSVVVSSMLHHQLMPMFHQFPVVELVLDFFSYCLLASLLLVVYHNLNLWRREDIQEGSTKAMHAASES